MIEHRRHGTPPPLHSVEEPAPPTVPELPHPHRVRVAARWIRWHRLELAGVATPLVPAATVSPWFAVLSALAATAWAWQEYQTSRGDPR